ncbi:hypothetical protein ABFY43_20810 [Bacillus pumilus]
MCINGIITSILMRCETS